MSDWALIGAADLRRSRHEVRQPWVSSEVGNPKRNRRRLLTGSRAGRRTEILAGGFSIVVPVGRRVATKAVVRFELGVVGDGRIESALELGAKEGRSEGQPEKIL